MLLRIFKTSQPLSWFLIVILIVVLRIGLFTSFYDPIYLSEIKASTPSFLYSFNVNNPWISHILSTIIVLISSFYLNQIIQKLNILTGINYLILLFSGIFLSFQPQMLVLSPVIIGTPLLLYSFPLLLAHKKDELPLDVLFNSTFMIGLTSLLYFPSILLLLIMLISFFYMSHFTWRHVIIASIGWFVPWVFHDILVFTFTNESAMKIPLWTQHWQFFELNNYGPFIAMSIVLAIIIFKSAVYLKISSRSIIRIRKALSINYWYLIIGVIATGFLVDGFHNLVGVIVFPLTVFFSVFHLEVKKWWLSDLLFVILFAGLLFNYMRL